MSARGLNSNVMSGKALSFPAGSICEHSSKLIAYFEESNQELLALLDPLEKTYTYRTRIAR